MLQKIRENVSGLVAWVIIILLIIPFAFWGINQYFDVGKPSIAAEVNGEEISAFEVEQAYQRRYNELARLFGDQLSPDMINQQALRMDVLNQMIMRELIEQKIDEAGYRPSDAAVMASIREQPAFQDENGQFSTEVYRRVLSYSGLSPAQYEEMQRRDLALEQLQRGLSGTEFATVLEASRLTALRDQGRRFAAVTVPSGKYRDQVTVAEEEVKAFYDENSNMFLADEKVDLAYVELEKSAFADDVEVTDEKLQEFYQQRVDAYASQEQRRASHILIEGDGDEALEKAKQVRARIEAGEDFATLAKEFSADAASAEEGGSLGLVQRGELVGPFEDKLFAMQEGEVSEPVKTEFGYHIIKLDEIRAPELPAFEEVRDELVADYQEQEAEQAFEDAVQQLTDITYADSGSLGAAADELGLEIRTVEGVTRGEGSGIAQDESVRRAAFGETVLKERMNSDPVRLDDDRVVVVRVTEHFPATARPLVEVADEIRERLISRKASEMAKSEAESVVERVKAGEAFADIAAEKGLEYRPPSVTLRTTSDLSPAFTEAVFSAPYPNDGPVIDVAAINATDYAVYGLTDVIPGKYAELALSERESRIRDVQRRESSTAVQAYLQELRNSADVTVYEKNLEQ